MKKQLQEIKDLEQKELIEKHYKNLRNWKEIVTRKKNHCGSPKNPSDYWFLRTLRFLEIKEEEYFL